MLANARNTVIRNLRLAESAEDGIFFGGLGRPSTETFVDNVVIDSHFRQAMSIDKGEGESKPVVLENAGVSYFEVPAGGAACEVCMVGGSLELHPPRSGRATLKFRRPLTGETADSPEALKCRFDDHYVPAKRAHAADISWGDPIGVECDITKPLVDRAKLSAADVKALDAAFLGRLAPGGEASALKGVLLRFGLSLAPKTGELEYDDVKKLVLLRDALLAAGASS